MTHIDRSMNNYRREVQWYLSIYLRTSDSHLASKPGDEEQDLPARPTICIKRIRYGSMNSKYGRIIYKDVIRPPPPPK